MRDNEVAARALGKDDVAIRRNVIIIASAISAMAGALLTFYVGAVNAESWTRITWTFWIWVMLIIGGAANNAILQLLKRGELVREPIPGRRGSRYHATSREHASPSAAVRT